MKILKLKQGGKILYFAFCLKLIGASVQKLRQKITLREAKLLNNFLMYFIVFQAAIFNIFDLKKFISSKVNKIIASILIIKCENSSSYYLSQNESEQHF